MALSNQATITLAVNVQNMTGLTSLTRGLQSLRSRIMELQRNPAVRSATGINNPAQAARQQAARIAASTAVTNANSRAQIIAARNATALARAERSLGREMGTKTGQARRQREELKGLTKGISDAEHKVDALWRASFRLTMLGADFTRMGQSIFGMLGGVMDTFGDFEFMANRAAGTLGVFETQSGAAEVTTRELQDAIMATSKELRLFPAEDVAKSVYYWGSTTGQVVETQQDLENVMKSLVPIMKGAALTETSYESAIKGTYGILSQYYGAVVETAQATGDYNEMTRLAEEVTVRMFYATQKTALEFDDLIQAFKMVGPVAAGVGASFEDMVELMSRLGDLGIRGSMAGRSFRQMFMRMVSPPGPARAAIDALFESFNRFPDLFKDQVAAFGGKSYMEIMFPEGEFVGTAKFLSNMALAVRDLTTAERISFLTKFSTANLLPTMIALIGQENRGIADQEEGYKGLGKSIEEMRVIFESSWGLLENSWQGVMGSFERSIENLKITLGRAFAEAFKPFLDTAADIIDRIQEWVLENEPLMEQLGVLAGTVGGALIALGSLFTLMGTAIGIVAGLRLAFEAFGGVFLRWTAYGAIVTGVVESIIRNWDDIQRRLQAVQAAFERAFARVFGYFSDGEDAVGSFSEAFADMSDTIVDVLLTAAETVAYFFDEVSKWKWLFDMIKTVGIPVMANFIALFGAAKLAMAIPLVGRLTGALAGLGNVIKANFAQAQIARLMAAGNAINIIGERGPASKIGGLSGAVRGLGSSLTKFAAGHFDLVLMGVAAFGFAAYQNNWLAFRSIVDSYTESFRDLDKELDNAFDNIFDREAALAGMKRAGEDGGIAFLGGFEDAIKSSGFADRGLLEQMFVGGLDDKGMFGELFRPLYDLVEGTAIREISGQFTDLWSQATFGAKDTETAVANVNKKLQDAGLSVMDFWRAWQYGQTIMGMTPKDAGLFGEAFARSMEDGVVTVGEMNLELRKLNGMSEWEAPRGVITMLNGMGDSALRALGIMTPLEEQAKNLATTHVNDLLAELNAMPVMGLSDDQYVRVATIIDELGIAFQDQTPALQKVITDAITRATGGGIDEGLDASQLEFGSIEEHVMQAFSDLGTMRVSPDVFQGIIDNVTAAFNAATANGIPEGGINWDQFIKDAFAEFDVSLVTETVYPKIQAMGESVVGAFASVFRPEKFKSMLKDVTSDKKGWANFFKAITDPILKAALAGNRGSEAQAIAEDYLQGLFEGFAQAWPAASGPEKEKMRTRLMSLFNEDSIKNMTPGMQRFGADLLGVMYQSLGEPIPDWVKQIIWDNSGQIAGYVQSGLDGINLSIPGPTIGQPTWGTRSPSDMGGVEGGNDKRRAPGVPNIQASILQPLQNALNNAPPLQSPPIVAPSDVAATGAVNTYVTNTQTTLTNMNVQVPAIKAPDTTAATTAVTNMASSIQTTLVTLGTNSTTWGEHVTGNFATGIANNKWKATNAAWDVANAVADILKLSEPKKGPLRGLVQSGEHLVENLIRGMHSKNPKIRAAAMNLAKNVMAELDKLTKNTEKNGDKLGHSHKKIKDDLDKTTKMMIDNVRGASTFSNYDKYLAYLEKVHSRIQSTHKKVKKDREDTVRDLTISKNDSDSKITYENKNKKVIEIRLIASSPDGTVDRVELKALRKGIMDGLALADLEHIVNVT